LRRFIIIVAAGVLLAPAVAQARGSAFRPLPVGIKFGYTVADEDPANRATVVRQYRIASESLVTYPGIFPSCTLSQALQSRISRKCRKARLGGGIVLNVAGASADPSQKVVCNLKLTLSNVTRRSARPSRKARRSRGALAIRLDGDPPQPADPASRTPGCTLPVHTAIYAPFTTVRLGGLPASELRFAVPDNLIHPAPRIDNSVRDAVSKVRRKTRRARLGRRVRRLGYNSMGCRRKRTTRVTFVDEQGRRFTAFKDTRC
jgi:hypothetical protein